MKRFVRSLLPKSIVRNQSRGNSKTPFGSKFALALPILIFRKMPIPQLDMSFCEKLKSALRSSNLVLKASFAITS